jgi:hypothetical protein
MEFRVDQRFAESVDDVLAMYTDPAFYATLSGLPKVGTPEVLSREDQAADRVLLRVRYAFTADLPRAALAAIDPKKLTWVEEATFDLAARTSRSRLLPDHYPDRLTASASATYEPAGDDHATRRVRGDVRIRMPFVGGQVEKAIVSGLREHLTDEERVAGDWLSGSR